MDRIFNLDNPVMAFMGKIADLVILNLLVIFCSLPVFTIGASWTALYYVTIKMVKKEESYIVRDFFRSFKQNFKQATLIWLIILLLCGIVAGDFMIYRALPDQVPKVVMIVVMILALFAFCTVLYIFPVLSRFENTIKNTIKNAFLISAVNVPYTFLLVILFALPFVLVLFSVRVYPFFFLFGISGPAYLASFLWRKIFKKIEPEEAKIADDMDFSIHPETDQKNQEQ